MAAPIVLNALALLRGPVTDDPSPRGPERDLSL